MKPFRLSRRTVLRGLLGGAAVAVGLPALEVFSDRGVARAAGAAFPTRFGVWFWGNGFAQGWAPANIGSGWTPTPQLEPLLPVKDQLTIVSGLKVYFPNVDPHGTGPKGVLVGSDDWGKTLDQSIAEIVQARPGATPRDSINVSVEATDANISRSARDSVNPPESSPHGLYDAFLANFVPPDTSDAAKNAAKALLDRRQSVLDAVGSDATALMARLGAADRARVEQHLDHVRSIEKSFVGLKQNIDHPPVLVGCEQPTEPPVSYPDDAGRPQISAISRALTDILVLALACEQTNVFTFQFCSPVSNMLFPGASKGFHQLTHEELGDQPEVRAIVGQILAEYVYFIQALAAVPEGNGTLLDNCCVLGMTDCSYGKSHAVDDFPILLAGGAGGRLRRGLHHRSAGAENASKLGLTLLQMFDPSVGSFGKGSIGATSATLTEILTT